MAHSNQFNRPLIKNHGKVMPFKKLPMGCKLAMVHYMAVDGEAWALPKEVLKKDGGYRRMGKTLNALLEQNMGYFDKTYGDTRFGLAMVPREEVEAALLKGFQRDNDNKDIKTIKDYHAMLRGFTVKHKTADWAVIFSSFDDDNILQDGWHRLTCYLKMKIKTIPCLYYCS